jgi:DNA-3-methyladenine glycosylase
LLPAFFARPAELVAPELIGCLLVKRDASGSLLWGVIVETEAYCQSEPACHGHRRRSPSNETLFGEPGRFYVYVSYGIHHCVNVVTGRSDWASGVLLRAAALPGEPERVAAGPALLARRFGIDRHHDAQPLLPDQGLWLSPRPPLLAAWLEGDRGVSDGPSFQGQAAPVACQTAVARQAAVADIQTDDDASTGLDAAAAQDVQADRQTRSELACRPNVDATPAGSDGVVLRSGAAPGAIVVPGAAALHQAVAASGTAAIAPQACPTPASVAASPLMRTHRIGISQGQDLDWRWYLRCSRSVSRRAKGDRPPTQDGLLARLEGGASAFHGDR